MWNTGQTALRITLFFTILTGIIYPLGMTGLCQALFPHRANGSLIAGNQGPVGSQLIGQNFTKPEYFHPRPSATSNTPYDGGASTGSNYGPTNQKLLERVKADLQKFRKENPDFQGVLPSDAVTTSASGLDPHISPAFAEAQAQRVALARGVREEVIETLIDSHTEGRTFGFLGEPRVNVLELNLALDRSLSHQR